MTRRIAIMLSMLVAAVLFATSAGVDNVGSSATAATTATSCAKFVAPSGSDSASGSLASPFRTVGKLVSSLQSGQTGCLRGGTYTQNLTISHGGITLTRYQGERATILGRLWVKQGADHVVVTGLRLDGKNSAGLPSPTVNGNDARFVDDDVTNEHTEICFIVGSSWGRAQRTVIQRNRIHDCGKLPSRNQDHGIYVEAADATQVLDNVIYNNADRGIQLYPDAQGTVVRGNIIDGNGEGIIFSGAGGVASSNSVVDHNAITSSTIRADVESWYPSGTPVGRNNVVHDNCIVKGAGGAINTSSGGFTATNNLIVSSAGYLNRGAGDYRLSSSSPCRGDLSGSQAPAGPNSEPPVSGSSPSQSTASR